MTILLLILGIILLIYGSDKLIDVLAVLANKIKIPKQILGLTLMSFGTSLPELVVSITSMINDADGITIGNVVGSNIQNILLILGLAAIVKPFSIKTDTIKKELPILILITLVFSICTQDIILDNGLINYLSRQEGLILLLIFSVFVYYIVKHTKYNTRLEIEQTKLKYSNFKIVFYILLSSVLLVIGSNLVIDNASSLAISLGISEYLVSLTIVALGTSLPELVTTIVASKKGETELAIGNIIGSCIINICIVLGLPISIYGVVYLNNVKLIDIIIMLASTILIFLFSKNNNRISRNEGIIMLIIFAVYYTAVILGGLYGI